MDVLNPQIITIGKRRYRKNPRNFKVNAKYEEDDDEEFRTCKAIAQKYDECKYDDETCDMDKLNINDVVDEDEDDAKIQCDKNDNYKLEIQIPSAYFGYIIGKGGEQKRRLESDTKTTIQIPSRQSQNDPLIIKAKSKSNVISCRNRLQVLVSSARQKQQFTHILTFPLNFDLLKKSLENFKNLVMKECLHDRGIDESIFQNPHKLHLTICTLVLMDENEKNEAVNILNEFNRKFIKEYVNLAKPIRINLKGLEYMNDDPSSVDVLYAKVETIRESNTNEDRLQVIADRVVQTFNNSNLMKRQFDAVKIHATIMNTLRRYEENADLKRSNERESFDARNVLRLFGNYDFGQYEINQLQISVRYTAASDGYYEALSQIKF